MRPFQQTGQRTFRLSYVLSIAECLFVVALVACNSTVKPPLSITHDSHTESTDDPTPAVIIRAVRDSVNGKTYSAQVARREMRDYGCSQLDVERDPNAKHNPELARCPHVGTFSEWKTVWVSENRPCPTLNDPDSAWHVQASGPGAWKVSLYGKGWRVDKFQGRLRVIPDQPCA